MNDKAHYSLKKCSLCGKDAKISPIYAGNLNPNTGKMLIVFSIACSCSGYRRESHQELMCSNEYSISDNGCVILVKDNLTEYVKIWNMANSPKGEDQNEN